MEEKRNAEQIFDLRTWWEETTWGYRCRSEGDFNIGHKEIRPEEVDMIQLG
jgi:hypothetical protein